MAKKFKSFEVYLEPDPKYQSKLVSKFINCLMWEGRKTIARGIMYTAMEAMAKKIPGVEPLEAFTKAIETVKPQVEVRSRRVGGATYQVPVEVAPKRQQSLAIRWVLQAVRKKKGRPIADRLCDELVAAFKGEGEAMTTRENIHKMAEANKAFAHFAW
ncbi:MAG: 30S ribosomal protein S7 [Planctomycetes bacterium]|nr:30S ribosomal protein S7 [Planctomycetota bacterium]